MDVDEDPYGTYMLTQNPKPQGEYLTMDMQSQMDKKATLPQNPSDNFFEKLSKFKKNETGIYNPRNDGITHKSDNLRFT